MEYNNHEFQDFMNKVNTESEIIRYELMKEGLELVIPETIPRWLKLVDSKDSYIRVIKAALSMMRKFEQGVHFEKAQEQVFEKEFGLRGYEIIDVNQILFKYSKKGEEYKQFLSEQFGVENDEVKRR